MKIGTVSVLYPKCVAYRKHLTSIFGMNVCVTETVDE